MVIKIDSTPPVGFHPSLAVQEDPHVELLAVREGMIQLSYEGLEVEINGLDKLGERLREIYGDFDAKTEELDAQRQEIRKLSFLQTGASAFGASITLGAAFASGVGEVAMGVGVISAILNVGHQLASHGGLYREISKSFGGTHDEVAARSQTLNTTMGMIAFASSIGSLFVLGGPAAATGLESATQNGASQISTIATGVIGIRQNKAEANRLEYEIQLQDCRLELTVRRSDQDDSQEQLRTGMKQIEDAFGQLAHLVAVQSRIIEEINQLDGGM